jgi:hypothetical protein
VNTALLTALGLCGLAGVVWVFAEIGPLASVWIFGGQP